ncbi:hypothetical protein [Pseudolysinimonas kribbensis]|uniref:hypothetical protein n=1 Tax=Pseudolysinimonas kribbensis TaxID=433641 RepID=UPI003D676824
MIDGWLRTEVALASAQAELGILPRHVRDALAAAADADRIDRERLWDETRVVGYPILPSSGSSTRCCHRPLAARRISAPPPRTSWTPGSCCS